LEFFLSQLGCLCEGLVVARFFLGDDSKQNDGHGFVYYYKLVRFFFCRSLFSAWILIRDLPVVMFRQLTPRFDFARI
jgi:hypothetical protein